MDEEEIGLDMELLMEEVLKPGQVEILRSFFGFSEPKRVVDLASEQNVGVTCIYAIRDRGIRKLRKILLKRRPKHIEGVKGEIRYPTPD